MDELARTKALLDQLNIGVLKCLDKKTGVCKIENDMRAPADRHNVLMWEQRNTCFLPEDLKSFYLTSDGFHLTWCVKMDRLANFNGGGSRSTRRAVQYRQPLHMKGDGPQPLGRLHINRVSQLTKLGGSQTSSHVNPSLADLEGDSDLEDEVSGLEKPTFDNRCKIFELDPCDGYGKVCLVYRENKADDDFSDFGMLYFDASEIFDGKHTSDLVRFGGSEPKVEIWFLDRSLRWHYLTDTFLAYYRLMMMHLGLPQWQYAMTDIGLSQQTQQWFNMFTPIRLELDRETACEPMSTVHDKSQHVQLDINKVFKGKTDKRKPTPSQTQNTGNFKKKPIVTSAKTQPLPGNRVTASSSQISNKGSK